MTLQDVLDQVREKANKYDPASYQGFLAIQITLKDLNEPFYVEIKDGKLAIEPYEYHDRQANIIVSSADYIKMINNKLDPVAAFTTGKIKIEGDIGKAAEFSDLLKQG